MVFKQTLFISDSCYNFKIFLPSESISMTHINILHTNMDRLNKILLFTDNEQDIYWVKYGSIKEGQESLQQNNKIQWKYEWS